MTDTVLINDVSEHQGAIDWAAYRRVRQAVFLRAHNGNRPDTRFAANRTGARPLAVVGAYQYLVADRDAAVQARDYLEVLRGLDGHEVPILDIEEGADLGRRATEWLTVVESETGRTAMVYSGDNRWTPDLEAAVAGRPRWVARYASRPPVHRWDIWQRSSTATVSGVTGLVDESVYPGDIAGLRNLLIGDGDEMAMTGPEFARLYLSALRDTADTGQFGNNLWQQLRRIVAEGAKSQVAPLAAQVAAVSGQVAGLGAAMAALAAPGGVDVPELLEKIQAAAQAGTEAALHQAAQAAVDATEPTP